MSMPRVACHLWQKRKPIAAAFLLTLLLRVPQSILPAQTDSANRNGAAGMRRKSQRATVSRPRPPCRHVLRTVLRRSARWPLDSISATGQAVADIGAGKGEDTWVFAEIVGPTGKVYAEEITEDLVKAMKKEVEERKLTQVKPLLGARQPDVAARECRSGVHAVGVPPRIQAARDAPRNLAGLETGRSFCGRRPFARHAVRLGAPRRARKQALLVGGDNGRARSN